MQELIFHTLDVFTDRIFGGNQLAVFPDAPELSTEVMQSIAREFNLSETVFVRPAQSPGALCKLRIFTPGAELPFAGHPTIGTAQLLVELGTAKADGNGKAIFAFDENAGLVPVEVAATPGGGFFTWLTAPRVPESRDDLPSREVLAAVVGLAPEDILADQRDAPVALSAGVPYVCIPVRDRAALARARLDSARWHEALASSWARDLYVFCHGSDGDVDVRARMFGPAAGIPEDPATGSAAAALGGYLWKRNNERPGRWIIAQGVEMGRPSTLHVEASGEGGELKKVRVGGSAVRVSSGTMRLPT